MTISVTRAPAARRLLLLGRIGVLALVVAGVIAIWMNRGALDPATITTAIGTSPAAPLLFLLAQLAASLLFFPRTILGFVAGLVFGLWSGLFWATLGCFLGGSAGFLIARHLNAGLIDLEALPRLGPILQRAEKGGWRAVTMLRLLPVVPHGATNYALGLTKLSFLDFTLGSLLGQLPMTIAYVSFGAAGGRVATGQEGWLVPVLVGIAAFALSLFLPRLDRSRSAAGD